MRRPQVCDTQEVSFSSPSETQDDMNSGEEIPTWFPATRLLLVAMCLGQDLCLKKSGFMLVTWYESMYFMGCDERKRENSEVTEQKLYKT